MSPNKKYSNKMVLKSMSGAAGIDSLRIDYILS